MLHFLAFAVFCFTSNVLAHDYFHSLYLDRNKTYHLSWKFNKSHIEFRTEVKTLGYVALGLSNDGSLKDADVFFAGVSNGKSYSSNYYGNATGSLSLQTTSEWHLMYFNKSDMKTTLTFCRGLSGPNMKINITQNTMRVLWGYNETDDVNDSFQPNGVRSLYLLQDKLPDPVMSNDTFAIEFRMNKTLIPPSKTTYWCKTFKRPTLDGEAHIVTMSPYVQEGNEAFVHHMLIYGCYKDTSGGSHIGFETRCYTQNMPNDWKDCQEVLFAWAIGGSNFTLPKYAGMLIGAEDGPLYYLLEMHYDNPLEKSGVIDSSGMKLIVTKTKRQYEAGILEVGINVRYPHEVIPPYAKEFKYYGHCEACGSMIKPERNIQWNKDGVQIIAVFLHAHLTARKIRLHHFRKGKQLTDIMYDNNYDFNYQETRIIKNETTLLKDDILQVECVYDTTQKTDFTRGGLSTEQEMCLAYLVIYPQIKLKSCLSDIKYDMELIREAPYYKDNQDAVKGMEFIVNGLKPEVGFTQSCHDRSNIVKFMNRPFPVAESDNPSTPTPTSQPSTTEKNSAANFCMRTGIIFISISYWLM